MADLNGCQRRNHSIAKPHNPRTVRQWRSLKNWKKEKCQMTTGKCQISKPKWRNLWESGKTSSDHETRTLSEKEFGKGALSANDIFSTTTPGGPEQLQTQFWAEDGLIAGIVEKIWSFLPHDKMRLKSVFHVMADFNGCQRRNHSIAKPHNHLQ